MHLLGFSFTPKWYSIAGMMVLLPLFTSLGIWQLNRAEEKIQLREAMQSRLAGEPIPLSAVSEDLDIISFQPVVMTGRYLGEKQFLWDNRHQNGQLGYEILTPFLVDGLVNGEKVVLVNRGFIARGRDRANLPDVTVDSKHQTLKGSVYLPSGKAFMLKDLPPDSGWPKVIQIIRLGELSELISLPVYPFMVQLTPPSSTGISPHKNWGYAGQWFLFALTLLVIFIALNLKKENNKENK